PGTFCPCTPNAARESTIVGADPRLPAIAISPHSANETTMPMIETMVACQNDTPNPSTNEPYDRPNTDTFAANHGQNRSRGFAVRSDSGMISMPACSISPGAVAIFSDMLPSWHRPDRSARRARSGGEERLRDAGEVVQVADAGELAGGVHREDRDADVHCADAQAGRRDRADRRAARHGVVRDELLRGHSCRLAPAGPGCRADGVGGVALVGVDLQDRSGTEQRLDDRVVLVRVVRVHRVAHVAGEVPGCRERAALLGGVCTEARVEPDQDVLEEGPRRPGSGRRAQLLVIERGEDRDAAPRAGR